MEEGAGKENLWNFPQYNHWEKKKLKSDYFKHTVNNTGTLE